MSYLTQLVDQIACLAALQDITPLTSAYSVLEANNDGGGGGSDDGQNRYYAFQVDEISNMEESVKYSPGFTVRSVLSLKFLPFVLNEAILR